MSWLRATIVAVLLLLAIVVVGGYLLLVVGGSHLREYEARRLQQEAVIQQLVETHPLLFECIEWGANSKGYVFLSGTVKTKEDLEKLHLLVSENLGAPALVCSGVEVRGGRK